MGKFQSTKVFDGFSTVFRQWKAEDTHCRFLHGYGISFKLWFEGQLDKRNWVWDFGGMKRAKGTIDGMSPKEWMDFMFDHTFIVAEDDPFKESFLKMNEAGVAQVRVVPATGAERFAQFVYEKVNPFIMQETNGRVKVAKVEFREHNKNSAIYEPGQD
jgi:6-pyruvoyltetrahydropterin/6-carboxytetrahydropterin synthase